MFYLWILCSVISTIYTYTWDVKMDWGLFSKSSGEYSFLREEIVYDNTVSFLNFITRTIHYVSVCIYKILLSEGQGLAIGINIFFDFNVEF